MLDFAIALGTRCTGSFLSFFQSQMRKIPPTSELEPALAPVTSHLEGVGNDLAACAAITLVHYTPPPFIAFIVPCNLETVKLFLKIRRPG